MYVPVPVCYLVFWEKITWYNKNKNILYPPKNEGDLQKKL